MKNNHMLYITHTLVDAEKAVVCILFICRNIKL